MFTQGIKEKHEVQLNALYTELAAIINDITLFQ